MDRTHAEKKMVNSILKFGFKDTTLLKWNAILELKNYLMIKSKVMYIRYFNC